MQIFRKKYIQYNYKLYFLQPLNVFIYYLYDYYFQMDEPTSEDENHLPNQPTVLLELEHMDDLKSNSMTITHTVGIETFSADQEGVNSNESRFRKALSFTQEEYTDDSNGNKTCSPEEISSFNPPLSTNQSPLASESYNELFLTQTLSDRKFYDDDEEDASKGSQTDSYSVNRMLSELMASQAVWGTQQQQQAERRVPKQQVVKQNGILLGDNDDDHVDDGVVPQLGNEASLDDRDFNETGKGFLIYSFRTFASFNNFSILESFLYRVVFSGEVGLMGVYY